MSQTAATLRWTRPEWIEQAHTWIKQAVAGAGYTLAGPIEQLHARIWSTVMLVPTGEAGTLYFKACEPPVEARMTVYLRGIQPENLPDLVAVDLEQGWMLMRDAGPMLRSFLKTPADLVAIEPALVQFARLQIAVSGDPERFFPLGADDRRLHRLPGMAETLLADALVLRVGEEDGLTADQHRQLVDLLPRYAQMCRELQTYAIPQTLHHDDFHDGNIFVSGEPGRYRFVFSDWEEVAVAHPFFSIMLCLRSVSWRAGFPDEATEAPDRMPPELNRLRDVYLEPWQRFEPPDRLVEAFNLAWRVGMVSRAMTWREFVRSIDPSLRADFTYIVPAWLSEFLIAMK